MDLPYIDTQTTAIDAPPSATWDALVARDHTGPSARRRERFASLLGCAPAIFSGKPGETGSTVPGFRVAHSAPPHELALEGGHRFSDYKLDFRIEDRGAGRSALSATTHAAFPGAKGAIYKTLVIHSRAHVVATRRILESVRRRAELGTLSR